MVVTLSVVDRFNQEEPSRFESLDKLTQNARSVKMHEQHETILTSREMEIAE